MYHPNKNIDSLYHPVYLSTHQILKTILGPRVELTQSSLGTLQYRAEHFPLEGMSEGLLKIRGHRLYVFLSLVFIDPAAKHHWYVFIEAVNWFP